MVTLVVLFRPIFRSAATGHPRSGHQRCPDFYADGLHGLALSATFGVDAIWSDAYEGLQRVCRKDSLLFDAMGHVDAYDFHGARNIKMATIGRPE